MYQKDHNLLYPLSLSYRLNDQYIVEIIDSLPFPGKFHLSHIHVDFSDTKELAIWNIFTPQQLNIYGKPLCHLNPLPVNCPSSLQLIDSITAIIITGRVC